MKKFIFIIYFLFNSCDTEKAIDVELNNLFQDNMVIQHNSVTPIWGTTKPNRRIKIEISWGDKYETVSDSIGNWRIEINTPQADKTSHTIEINTSNDKIILKDLKKNIIKSYIIGKNINFFKDQIKNKIEYLVANNLKNSIINILKDIILLKKKANVILLSPASASFDQFSNFEKRGEKFKELCKIYATKYLKN